MKSFFLSVICSLFLTSILWSQAMLKKADYAFEHLQFYKAGELYEYLSGKQDENEHILERAAESFQFIGERKKAIKFYKRLLALHPENAKYLYKLASLTKGEGDYERATELYQKLLDVDPSNQIAGEQIMFSQNYDDLTKDVGRYEINSADFNSVDADFCPIEFNSLIIFSSTRAQGSKDLKSSWDMDNLTKLFVTEGASRPSLFNIKQQPNKHLGPIAFSDDYFTFYLTEGEAITEFSGEDHSDLMHLSLKIGDSDGEGGWTNLRDFYLNSEEYSIGHATLNEDETILYFASNMPGGHGDYDIWACIKDENGNWGEPINLGDEINTPDREMFPYYRDSVLYFASKGHFGLGNFDVFRAKQNKGGRFRMAQNLGYPLNTQFDDFALILDESSRHGLLTSNRSGGQGLDDIYHVNILKPFPEYTYQENLELANAKENVSAPENQFKESKNHGDSLANSLAGKVIKSNEDDESLSPMVLDNDYFKELRKFVLLGRLEDDMSKKPLEDVSLTFINTETNQYWKVKSDKDGRFRVPLDTIIRGEMSPTYRIEAKKDGYLPAELIVENINPEEELDLTLKFAERLRLKKINIGEFLIQNIYFELNSADINSKAALQLKTMIDLMKQYKTLKIEVGAHTDVRGSATYNQNLSQRRAASTVNFLVKNGIEGDRLSAEGYGEQKPINKCVEGVTCSEAQHAENRRIEFKVLAY